MDRDELISKMQFFVYALRRRRWEQVLATLTLTLFAFGVYLKEAWKQLEPAVYLAYAAFALGVIFAVWLAVLIWRQAALPQSPPDEPVSNAVKGLLPFTSSDGKLFARLGRRNEVRILHSHAQDTQVAITVVRGQSGAGKTSLLQAGLAFRLGDNQRACTGRQSQLPRPLRCFTRFALSSRKSKTWIASPQNSPNVAS